MIRVFSLVTSKLGRVLASAGAFIMLLTAVFLAGRKDYAEKVELEEIKEAIATQGRIADAPVTTTRSDAIERLRASGQLRD